MIWIAEAEVIHQITTRQVGFPKPIKDYKVLDVYGRNVVTTEGPEWRMHRKALAPGFNEKNNALVFTESVAQAQGMIRKWMDGSDKSSRTLNDIPADSMRVALHIISAMGFGVRLLWPGDVFSTEDKDSGLLHMGDEPIGEHTMSFEKALATVLDDIYVLMLTPRWLLSKFSTSIGVVVADPRRNRASEEGEASLGIIQELEAVHGGTPREESGSRARG